MAQHTDTSPGLSIGNVDNFTLMSLYKSCVWFMCHVWCAKIVKGNSEVWFPLLLFAASVFVNLG